jgi:hypothetical protein
MKRHVLPVLEHSFTRTIQIKLLCDFLFLLVSVVTILFRMQGVVCQEKLKVSRQQRQV